jgi:hypothetical protein
MCIKSLESHEAKNLDSPIYFEVQLKKECLQEQIGTLINLT